jgi:hypothetical protein
MILHEDDTGGIQPQGAGAPAETVKPDKNEGPISAAIIATGVGATALGLFTSLAEANTSVKDWLQFSDDVGPLSGKTIVAVSAWIASWAILHVMLRGKQYETGRAFIIALVLIGFGVLGTFPTFFQIFE